MGMRPPCCDKLKVKKGLWTAEEDAKLLAYVSTHGTGNWTNVPKKAGLKRCGKSCRLRWTNYLRPNLKNEGFTSQEEDLIVTLHATIGSRWSIIANQLPGRTDNDVKNYWNTKLSKKLVHNGIDPVTHRPISEVKESISSLHLAADATGRRRSGLHDSRIDSLNKDLKNILLSRHVPSTSPSSSSSSSIAAHRNIAENAAALPPPLPELEWIEFLSEDAFLSCFEEQDAYNCPSLCADADSSSTGDVGNEFMSSVLRSAASTTSFVQAILDRDREMISDYSSGLLSDH